MQYLKRQAIYAMIGLTLMVGASRLPFRRWRTLAPTLLVVSIGALLAVLVIGASVNGARRWIALGPAAFQPSELAKLTVAIWIAAYLTRRRPPRTLMELARPLGLVIAVFCVLLLAEPELGTAIALVLIAGAILLVAGTPVRPLLTGAGIVTFVGIAAIWFEPYRRARLFSFINPWQDAQGAGYQTTQALISLGSGGPLGRGLGQSIGKDNYLPEAHTDMIFAVIGEELGLIGTTCLILAYLAFAYVGFRIALRCRDAFGKRLAAGLTVLICRPGRDQPGGRHGPRSAHRDPAAVRVVRRLEPHRRARRRGHPP